MSENEKNFTPSFHLLPRQLGQCLQIRSLRDVISSDVIAPPPLDQSASSLPSDKSELIGRSRDTPPRDLVTSLSRCNRSIEYFFVDSVRICGTSSVGLNGVILRFGEHLQSLGREKVKDK